VPRHQLQASERLAPVSCASFARQLWGCLSVGDMSNPNGPCEKGVRAARVCLFVCAHVLVCTW
jgi:hypothetical protein